MRAAILVFCVVIFGRSAGYSQTNPAPPADSALIIQFLERTIGWYRQLDNVRRLATEPGELLIVNDDQQMANQVVQLAFEFAKAYAEFIQKQTSSNKVVEQAPASSRYQSLFKLSETLDKQVRDTRAEVDSLRQKLAGASGRQYRDLQAQVAEVQSELSLAEARRNAIRAMTDFVGGATVEGLGATGLRAEIETLARSVPAALARQASGPESASLGAGRSSTPPPVSARKTEPTGVFSLLIDLFSLSGKDRTLTATIQLTDSVKESARQLRSPLVSRLREMSKTGDDLAQQADSADQAGLEQEKKDLDALTAQFKQISAVVLPLSKQSILIDLFSRNLSEWQDTVKGEFSSELKSLLFRIAVLTVVLAVVLGAASLWRRTILRYVHDPRRRHQFLLLRKIVLWCVVALILVVSFANEIGSVATFAGLMTAGVAVALQGVILSVVGYFFLIGKYGIRVGDLVQAAGVTGEVVDIGLVRFHLLEMVKDGGKTPTGRVVAFSNAIVFQSGAGLFKQVPGTNFLWHEVSLALSPESDCQYAEGVLRRAVEAVFSEYRDEMEKQRRHLERAVTVAPVGELHPSSHLRLNQSTPEVVIRYPVVQKHAAEVDNRVTLELLKSVEHEPKVKLAGSGTAGIKLKTDVS